MSPKETMERARPEIATTAKAAIARLE